MTEMHAIRSISIALVVAVWSPVAHANPTDDYVRQVKPLLEKRCAACHGALKQESKLRLDWGNGIRQGGENGPAIIAHEPDASLIVQRISARDPQIRMPPDGAPLSVDEIALVASWIRSGASTPGDEREPVDPRSHWSFLPPVRPPIPIVSSPWTENPIDAFVAQRHSELGLKPLEVTTPAALLRRVYFDLIGLPPTRTELQQFLSDPSDVAYERVIDGLLNRPEYGERWGRHWMDVWRYSDWYGRRAVPDVMNSYPHVWRWRDWIVNSLNDDKGYDRMVTEMLAADELAPHRDEDLVATGFIVRNWFKWNYENWMKDNVEHTSKAFLGLTLNCAHCHDHKYDPLSQEDYFRFRAFFEPLELRHDRIAGSPDPGPFVKYVYAKAYGPSAGGMIRVFDEKLSAQTYMYEKGDARNRIAEKEPVAPGVPASLGGEKLAIAQIELPPEAYYPGLKAFVRDEEQQKLHRQLEAAQSALQAAGTKASAADRSLDELRKRARAPGTGSQNVVQQPDRALNDGRESTPATAQKPPSAQALVEAEQAVLDTQADMRLATQHVGSIQAAIDSLAARIGADDAKYRGIGESESLKQSACMAQRRSQYESALLRLAHAEQGLIAAQRNTKTDDKAKAALEKSRKELTDARTQVDAARDSLAKDPDSYTPLSPIYPSTSTGRRLALARWITSRSNPLAARVAVNHMWLRHFGRGLVDTPTNFGRSGHLPTHAGLLDFLAVELMEGGWSMKRIHKLIVTSRTYLLQSSWGSATGPNLAIDPDNRFYWRGVTQRLEAEAVRDNLLACAGELDLTRGGPEIDHAEGLQSNRRSLYFSSHGENKMQFLELFDAPDVCDCYQRTTSVRPQQALALANSELPLRLSKILAEKLWQSINKPAEQNQKLAGQSSPDQSSAAELERQFIIAAFETTLARRPASAELEASIQYLKRVQTAASTPQRTSETGEPKSDIWLDARQSLVHALFNHNDFITIR